MATSNDTLQVMFEESPIYEGAPGAGTTPGTGTTPNRLSNNPRYPAIQTWQSVPAPGMINRADEVRGIPGAVSDEIDQFAPTFSFTERAYLNDLVFWLHAAGFTGTVTQGDGSTVKDPDNVAIPATAYRWVFTKRTGINAKTFTSKAAYPDEGIFVTLNGCALNALSMNAQGELTGSGMGLYFTDTTDPNLAPTYDSPDIPHLRRRDWTIPTWYANKGVVTDFTWAIATALNPDRDPGVSSYFPTKMIFGDDFTAVTGSMAFASLAKADQDTLLAGAPFAAKHKWITPVNIAATSYKYSMWLEVPSCQYRGGGVDALRNARRHGGNFDWFAAWDVTAGYDAKFTIVAAQTALETFV